MIAAGGAHSVLVSSNEDVFVFGLNNLGQLGLGDEVPCVTQPVKTMQFTSFKIKEISCGDEMTAILNVKGDLFTAGWKCQS